MVVLSPGVVTTEKDFSSYVPAVSTTTLGLVLTASKGPVGQATIITNEGQLINTFGAPNNDQLGLLAATQFLSKGNQLHIARVVAEDAVKASTTITDGAPTSPLSLLEVGAAHVGAGYNDISFVVTDNDEASKTFTASVVVAGTEISKKYGVTFDATSPSYVEDAFADLEDIIVQDLTDGGASTLPTNGSYPLNGGSDGGAVTAGHVVLGVKLFSDVDSLIVNLLAAPGFSQAGVINELISVCEARGDSMALIDTPIGLKPTEVVDWANGKGTGEDDPGQAINSSYAAIYWSWLKVLNPFTNKQIWCPPSGLVAAVYAHNDSVAEPWFAPAGLRRGGMTRPIAIEYSPNSAERDLLYSQGNVINSLVNFAQEGITIWGQRTAQRQPSATDRVNVRRLLLMSRRAVALSTKFFTFEQNDEFTWEEWKDTIEPFFASIKARRGLYDYMVQMDSTTVTSAHIDRGEMPGRVYLKPTKSAEFIAVDFVLSATGADFK